MPPSEVSSETLEREMSLDPKVVPEYEGTLRSYAN